MFHLLAARALYSSHPHAHLRCPGPDCAGYKMLFGMDYTSEDRAAQHQALRGALLEHMRLAPESLVVVEEYDKLDCHMRGFFRQLLEGGQVGNVSLARSVVVLESNTGYTTLHSMLQKARSREAIAPEHAQRELKDLVFTRWAAESCESRADTLKMVSLVDFFLPFFPLERVHVERLFELRLRAKSDELAAKRLGNLTWDQAVVTFLTDRVEFGGDYPIEGGKEVGTLVSRYVSRPVREWAAAQQARLQAAKQQGTVDRSDTAPVGSGVMKVERSGRSLVIELSQSKGGRWGFRA